MTVATTKVLRNGQMTIPKDVRDAIGLKDGATVLVRVTGSRQATITVLPAATASELYGSLPPRDAKWSLAEARRKYRAGVAGRRGDGGRA